MGCPSEAYLGHNLTFSVCTHDADTGALTDAASVPTYRVYEDETATAILTGSMAKLDDANTTGFYTEQIACTTGNGFEHGKVYTVYIEATVDGITGGIAFAFRVVDLATVVDAVVDEVVDGTITLRQALRAFLAALGGKLSGAGTTTVTIRDPADTADRIVATVDSSGNRSAVTLTLT